MKKKLGIVYTLLIVMNFLTGCWSQKELTDIAFVTALGIDKTDDGNYLVTIQIINPKNMVGGGQQGGIQGPPVTIYQGTGDTILEAVRETSQHVSRILYFAHANLVVIGEELAREGIMELLDILERSSQFRVTARLIIARKTSAEQLLQILTPIDQIPANKILKALKFTERNWGENVEVNLGEVMDDIYYKGAQPIISGFLMEGDKEKGATEDGLKSAKVAAPISAEGLAIFKDDKLITWAEKETARGILWIRNKVKSTIVNIDWKGQKEAISFRTLRSKSTVRTKLKNGKPEIHVHIDTEGSIGETHVPIDLSDPKLIQQLEKIISKEIKYEIIDAIELAKEQKTDVFRFGQKLRVNSPKYWAAHMDEWSDTLFPDTEVKVSVHAFIRRSELRSKPFFYEIKKNKGVE